jgi:hypothetical protein
MPLYKFKLRPPYSGGKTPTYTLDKGFTGIQSQSGSYGEVMNLFPLPEIGPCSSSPIIWPYELWDIDNFVK